MARSESLGLPDYLPKAATVLFVGINPGLRSARLGHHFAGYSNRFWKLLAESGLTPHQLQPDEDHTLPALGFGLTNLIARPTAGIDTLRPAEFVAGVRLLRRKVRRTRPRIVALVGVTLYRVVAGGPRGTAVRPGAQSEMFEGGRLFVLPNPSGRNAHYGYEEMLAIYRDLAAMTQAGPAKAHAAQVEPLGLVSSQGAVPGAGASPRAFRTATAGRARRR